MTPIWIRAGDALSQLGNVLIYNGDSNHSISGDAYRFKRMRLMWMIDKVFGAGHCEAAHRNDVAKAVALVMESNMAKDGWRWQETQL